MTGQVAESGVLDDPGNASTGGNVVCLGWQSLRLSTRGALPLAPLGCPRGVEVGLGRTSGFETRAGPTEAVRALHRAPIRGLGIIGQTSGDRRDTVALMFWITLAAAATCDDADNASMRSALDAAELAYTSLDLPTFAIELGRAQAAFGCLSKPLELDNAARLHQLLGLQAFTDKDTDLAERSFAAARAADPDRELPTSLAPARHPVRALFVGFNLSEAPPSTAVLPRDGGLVLDGRETLRHRQPLPTLFQHQIDGEVVQGAYLYPHQKLPNYAVAKRGGGFGVSVPVLVAGGAIMAAGGVLLAVYQPQAAEALKAQAATPTTRAASGFSPGRVEAIKTMGIVAPVMLGAGGAVMVSSVVVGSF